MALFLNTRGRAHLGLALCDRCRRKFPIDDLVVEPDTGLRVCVEDRDERDPWRLPPRRVESQHLPFVRPETPLTIDAPYEPTPLPVASDPWPPEAGPPVETGPDDLVFEVTSNTSTISEG